MITSISKHTLSFKFEAGTSRGTLLERDTYFIILKYNGISGIGEASPLSGLSIDFGENFESNLRNTLSKIKPDTTLPTNFKELTTYLNTLDLDPFPSIRFGLETAFLDLMHGGTKKIFDTRFFHGIPIPINGLIWMGPKDFMIRQAQEKITSGFDCIKMKVGARSKEDELSVLQFIREVGSDKHLELRIDANGAFTAENAMELLEEYARFDLHSIEQPIGPGQWAEMAALCKISPIKIALDEELIGVTSREQKAALLDCINPAYIILKPTLVGGFHHCNEWIELATERNIGWWMTSALESNIGLNAICQYTGLFPTSLPQGLGTGSLYTNNVASPLTIEQGKIRYDQNATWGDLPSCLQVK